MSVRHALLALLSEGPTYGLQLREEFQARTGEVWPLNSGQVYTTLQRLERDGLIESDGGDGDGPQKRFRITAEGERELAGWLRTPPDLSAPPRDEVVMKVLGLSVADLALGAGMTVDEIECIEEGGTEPTVALLRLAAALDADVRLTAGHDLGSVWFETHAA